MTPQWLLRTPSARASALAEAAFRGKVTVLTANSAAHRQGQRLRHSIESLCQGLAPPSLQRGLDPSEFHRRVADLRNRIAADLEIVEGFRSMLLDTGHDPTETFWDHPQLRVMPGRDVPGRARLRRLAAHRDTWGSNLMAQINWWMNLYPHPPGQGLVMYPGCWDSPVENASADWDFNRLLALRAQGQGGRYPRLPLSRRPPDPELARALDLPPDQPVVFSGAQLHGSGMTQSFSTRLSVEFRVLRTEDLLAGVGAPNVDGRAPHVMLRWFRRLSDDMPLERAVKIRQVKSDRVTAVSFSGY